MVSTETSEFFKVLRPLMQRLGAGRSLSPGKFRVLAHLSHQGPASMSELAVTGQVSQQGISLAVRELERLGLVERVPDERDRRRSWIHVTAQGRIYEQEQYANGLAWLDQVIEERLTEADRRTLAAAVPVLGRLTEAVDE